MVIESLWMPIQKLMIIVEMNELWNGLYPIAFEPSVTQNAYDKGVEIEYFHAIFSRPWSL